VQALSDFEKNRHLPSQAQDPSGVTYAQKILKDEARIDWSLSAVSLDRKIRAFNPFPGASFDKEGVLFKAWGVSLGDEASLAAQPGTILAIDRQGVHVATGAGSLVLTELQKPGGKRTSASQLAQNLSWVEGSLLA